MDIEFKAKMDTYSANSGWFFECDKDLAQEEMERIEKETKLTANTDRIQGFKAIIAEYKLKVGIEIGVREANFSRFLMEETNLEVLYGVDCNQCENAVKLEKESKGRYRFLHASSPKCSTQFPNNSFDFIHIDASHKYHAVKDDLEHWWPKLKIGGCFSGDDYMDFFDQGEGQFGVMKAVNEFCAKEYIKFNLIGCCESAMFRKVEFGEIQGKELMNRVEKRLDKFKIVPNWWLIKR